MIYQISPKDFFKIIREAHNTVPGYMLRTQREFWVYERADGTKLMGFRSEMIALELTEHLDE